MITNPIGFMFDLLATVAFFFTCLYYSTVGSPKGSYARWGIRLAAAVSGLWLLILVVVARDYRGPGL